MAHVERIETFPDNIHVISIQDNKLRNDGLKI